MGGGGPSLGVYIGGGGTSLGEHGLFLRAGLAEDGDLSRMIYSMELQHGPRAAPRAASSASRAAYPRLCKRQFYLKSEEKSTTNDTFWRNIWKKPKENNHLGQPGQTSQLSQPASPGVQPATLEVNLFNLISTLNVNFQS